MAEATSAAKQAVFMFCVMELVGWHNKGVIFEFVIIFIFPRDRELDGSGAPSLML